MIFYSHSSLLADGRKVGIKTIATHWNNVYANSLNALDRSVDTILNNEQFKSLLKDLCSFHDLGKYTAYFQKYLLTDERVDHSLKAHARFGAYAIFRKYQEKNLIHAALLYFVIVNHHGNLNNIRDHDSTQGSGAEERKRTFYRQKDTLEEFLGLIKQDLEDEKLPDYLCFPDRQLHVEIKEIVQQANIQYYFLLNYLFSLLIESDKLDASETPFYALPPVAADLVDRYRPLINSTITNGSEIRKASQNELRSYCRSEVVRSLSNIDLQAHRLFTLTAPTGIGKTLIALDFALKLKAIIRKQERREARIIYALPFINIIEQSYHVYKEVFSNEHIRLLAHYQYADALEQQNNYNEDKHYDRKMMAFDTWQCDVVITTFVQFLQTLIGNKNKLLKKFNHFAGSIVILDEVQTIRLGQLPLIGAALYYLSKFLNTRIVLMTATKPKIFELANQEILDMEGEHAKSIELLPDHERIFGCFHRTKIVSLIDRQLVDENDFLEGIFRKKWSPDRSCIIVCNTVKRSLALFRSLIESVKASENPVYYLSTNIIPLHRQKVIAALSSNIQNNRKPILIATQCVEAGVDLDFDMGFRDIGPVDSIIQVAGRINRNNHPDKQYSPLYIVDFGDCKKVYDPITNRQAEKTLQLHPEVLEEGYLEIIDSYFSQVAKNSAFDESREIFESMKCLKYESMDAGADRSVSSFKVINERSATLSVFIEVSHEAIELKNAFIKLLHKEISPQEFSLFKKDFHQHILSVPDHLPKAKELMRNGNNTICDGIYYVSIDKLADFYNEQTGFDRSREDNVHSMFL